MAEPSKCSSLVHSPPRLIPQLPDEISVLCIARVPRFLHPTLALVSRSWRSFLSSPLLFSLRSDLGLSQLFLYINVQNLQTNGSKWYLLDRHPQNPSPLLPLPPPPIPTVGSVCAAVDPTIFVLGGSLNGIPSPEVQIFDARLNRWSIGPQMRDAQPNVASISGRIYAFCRGTGTSPYAEVLDPAIGAWAPVPSPDHIQGKWMKFDPAGKPSEMSLLAVLVYGLRGSSAVVDGVFYTFGHWYKKIMVYDRTADMVKMLQGWEKELPKFLSGFAMGNVGGLLCVVFSKRSEGSEEMEIGFAGIKVTRKSCGEFWGSVVWTESSILPLPQGSFSKHVVMLEL